MEVYFLSTVRPMRLVTPRMEAQGGGSNVNNLTAWSFQPQATFPTSAVFRADLASSTKIFADESAHAATKREDATVPRTCTAQGRSDLERHPFLTLASLRNTDYIGFRKHLSFPLNNTENRFVNLRRIGSLNRYRRFSSHYRVTGSRKSISCNSLEIRSITTSL